MLQGHDCAQHRYLLGMTVAIACAQIAASRALLEHFRYGPCEWLWRSLTLRRRIPIRRASML